jgi:hypothetical protein
MWPRLSPQAVVIAFAVITMLNTDSDNFQQPTTVDIATTLIARERASFEARHLGPVKILDPEVQVYGDVAILTYREAVTGVAKGQPVHYTGKATMVYVKRQGEWRGVHYHESVDDCGH